MAVLHPRMDKQSLVRFRRERLAQAKLYAQSRNGDCLSDIYANKDFLLIWLCENAHIFPASWANVMRKRSWCTLCGIERRSAARRIGIEKARADVESRGWTLLSTVYVNKDSPLVVRCEEGHVWKPSYGNIARKHGCPHCRSSHGENVCRAVLERAFGDEFPTRKPKWLKGLQLDGYSERIGLAFEFNGKQHYKNTRYFDEQGGLDGRKERDRLKKYLCKRNGVRLITVSYRTPISRVPEVLRKRCEELGFLDAYPDARFVLEESDAYTGYGFVRLRRVVARKQGRVLSVIYDLGEHAKFECVEKHRWKAVPYQVMQGRWCGKCKRNARFTLGDIQRLTAERPLECMSSSYKNMRTPMTWRCKKCQHKWPATAYSVIGLGTGCPACSDKKRGESQRKTIEDCCALAVANRHRCLSESYKNSRSPMTWECLECHGIFVRSYEKVSSGRWCSICRGTRRSPRSLEIAGSTIGA